MVLDLVHQLRGLFHRQFPRRAQPASKGLEKSILALDEQLHLAGGVKERGLISVSQRIQEVLNDGIRTSATAQNTTEIVEAEAHHFQVGKTLYLPGKTT